jgi:ADP-heptose:LPS heptosyltransferase
MSHSTLSREDQPGATLANVKRVLIYRLGSLGDTVVALPALHLVARSFPQAERTLLTNVPINATAPAAAAVLGDSNLIHRYIHYPSSTRNLITLGRIAFTLRRYRPQVLIYLAAPRGEAALQRDVRFFSSCGISTIYGLPTGDRAVNLLDPATGFYESEAHRLARTLLPLGDAEVDQPSSWDLQLSREELAFGEEIAASFAGNPYIVCAPGCKAQANDWEDENWSSLFAQLSARFPNLGLLLTGAPSDYERNQRLARSWKGASNAPLRLSSQFVSQIASKIAAQSPQAGGNVLNISGAASPRHAAAILVHAAMYIGPDSGPMHIAAAVGTPCVSIFSARNLPGIWFPYSRRNGQQHHTLYHRVDCSPCGLETCIEQKKKCILSIQPSEPLAVATRILEPVFRTQNIAQLS